MEPLRNTAQTQAAPKNIAVDYEEQDNSLFENFDEHLFDVRKDESMDLLKLPPQVSNKDIILNQMRLSFAKSKFGSSQKQASQSSIDLANNRLSMKLPIYQLLQAQFQEKFEQKFQDSALVALKLLKKDPIKYTIRDNKIYDEDDDSFETEGISLFDKEKNEDIFQKLNIEQHIWDCLSNGKNISFFAVNDKCKKSQLSQTFNKTGFNSQQKPGMIRLAIESVFAYIFHDSSSEFVIKIQYLEVNNEQVFDLLNKGQENSQSTQVCCSIDQMIDLKKSADEYRLVKVVPQQERSKLKSTYIFKIIMESVPKRAIDEYKFMDKKCKILLSELTFVEIVDFSDLTSVIRQNVYHYKKMGKTEKFSIKQKSQVIDLLTDQLEGNSKVAFFCNLPTNCEFEERDQILEFANIAKDVNQMHIKTNTIQANQSKLIEISEQIEQKQKEMNVLEFQIKSRPTSLINRESGKKFAPSKGQMQTRNTLEEIDFNQKKTQKFRILNEIAKLQSRILNQQNVAKIIKQFQWQERIQNLLASAKQFQLQELECNQKQMRQTVADFIRASIRESRDNSIAGALRMSVASKIKNKSNYKSKLNQLSQGMEKINEGLRIEEAPESEEKRKTITEVPKFKDSEESAFLELQNQDIDQPLGSSFMQDYLQQRKISSYKKNQEKKLALGDEDLLAADDYLKDLLDLDDANLLDNFENLNIENIMFEGEELQLDLNIMIEVPDYLNENQTKNNFIEDLSTFIVNRAQEAMDIPEDKIQEEENEEELSEFSSHISSDEDEIFDISRRSGEEDDSIRTFQNQTMRRPPGRAGTIIQELDEEDLDDSFENKQIQQKMSIIERQVQKFNQIQEQKIRASIKKLGMLRQQTTVKMEQKYLDIDPEIENRLTEQVGEGNLANESLMQEMVEFEDDMFNQLLNDQVKFQQDTGKRMLQLRSSLHQNRTTRKNSMKQKSCGNCDKLKQKIADQQKIIDELRKEVAFLQDINL